MVMEGGGKERDRERKRGGGGGVERECCVLYNVSSKLALFITQFVPIMGINVQH